MESESPDAPLPKKPAPRATTIRYLGFESTSEGRSYRLRVDGNGEPRLVTVRIPNEAFVSHKARFQDAPELCVARVQREIDSSGDLRDGLDLVLTPGEVEEYREALTHRSSDRRPRAPRDSH